MPRGRRPRKNKCNENALTTRLIQISLRMDDHIYNNKPITSAEAASYLQEIASLKLRCLPTNARASQVIEKLTRLMGNVLKDDDIGFTSNSNNQFLQLANQFVRSASPVYSLPDEDRILTTELNVVEDLNLTHITDDNVTYIDEDLSDKRIIKINSGRICQDQDDSTYCETAMEDIVETIDITNNSDIEEGVENVAVTNKPNITMDHVNNGISKMTLKDLGRQNMFCKVNDTCSQSILDNFDNDITNEAVKEQSTMKVGNVLQGKLNSEPHNTNNLDAECKTPLKVSSPVNNKNKLVFSQPIVANVDKTLTQRSDHPEKTDKIRNRVINTKDNKIKKRRTKKSNEAKVDNTPQPGLQTVPYTTKNYENTSKIGHDKENCPKAAKKPNKRKKVNEIYNENVENDLSWIENIRFVREVSPSEHDPSLTILQDDFWNNFQLPSTWDDFDFNA